MNRQRAIVKAISIVVALVLVGADIPLFAQGQEEYLAPVSKLIKEFREHIPAFKGLELNPGIVTPADIRTSSRRKRNLSLPVIYAIWLSEFIDTLSPDAREFIFKRIFAEAVNYEPVAHFPAGAWELFRVLYAVKRLGISEDERNRMLQKFIEGAMARQWDEKKNGDKIERYFTTYMDAFSHLSPDLVLAAHLDYAEKLLNRDDRNKTDIELAQYHIGRVLGLLIEKYGTEAYKKDEFKSAMDILKRYGAIDKDDKGNLFPLGSFARDLARRDALIRYYVKGNIKSTTLRAVKLEQFEKFGQDIAVELQNPGVIEGEEYSYEKLQDIGKGMLDEVAVSIHVGGKGERYDTLIYDAEGNRVSPNKDKGKAKGVYRLPVDNAASYVEITIRQVTGYNCEHEHQRKIPLIVYTSIFTNDEVCELIKKLGYSDPIEEGTYSVYRHNNRFMPEVRVVKCYTTHNFDALTGDFVSHERLGIPAGEAVWSDAHDSSFIDLVASGTAYELLSQGRRYITVTNMDNRAGVLDPALVALIKLRGKALINELVKKPKGQKGGTAVRVKNEKLDDYPAMKRIVIGGRPVFLIEGFEFGGDDGPLWEELKREAERIARENRTASDDEMNKLIEEYFPLFNTASYVVDIKKYTAQAFGMGESEVEDFLRKFHNARNNPEISSRMRFELLESAYKFRMQSLEEEKRYREIYEKTKNGRYDISAQRASNLAGDQTRVVDTLFVEVPEGKDAGEASRFEPQKEQLRNLIRLHRFYEFLKSVYGADVRLGDIREKLTDVGVKKAVRGPAFGDIVKQTAARRKKGKWDIKKLEEQTLGVIADTIMEGILETMIPSIKRLGMKKGRRYPKGEDDTEDVIGNDLKGKIDSASGINRLGVGIDKVYFLDTKWQARAKREYSGGVIGELEDLTGRLEYKGLLDWFESKGINSIAISGDIEDIVGEFFDVIIKVIERDEMERLEDIINDLGIFNLYITQDESGKRLVITSPVELRMVEAVKGLLNLAGNRDSITGLEGEADTFIRAAPRAETHFIRLDVDRLGESSSLDYWKKVIARLTEYKTTSDSQLFQFVYFSGNGKVDVDNFLADNKLANIAIPQGTDKTKIITLIDPADIKEEKDMAKDTLYLPIPYMRGALSMAAEVVLLGGTVDRLTPIVKSAIVGLYREVLGRDVTDDDIIELFTKPWDFLPAIRRVIEDIETMRRSIQMTEMAA